MALDPWSIAAYANPTTVDSVYWLGRLFMNRGPQKLGEIEKNSPEDAIFCDFYEGAVLDAWNTLCLHALVPKEGWFFHLFWTLMFVKLYGTEQVGAVDSKTLRKWVWPFTKALAERQYKVVSDLLDCIFSLLVISSSCFISDFI